MTTLPDLLYVALFAVAVPLLDYLVFWPAFRRRSQADPARARTRLWKLGHRYRVAAGRRRGGAVGGERPILDVVRIFRARRLAVVDIHRLVPAARGLPRLCGRDPRPQLRCTGERAAADRKTHHRPAAHADRNVLVRWGVADRGVLRGVSVSRLLHLGLRPVARLVGRRGAVPSDLRDRASVPGMEWRPPHGNRRRALHAGRGDLRLPLAGDRAARPPRSRPAE